MTVIKSKGIRREDPEKKNLKHNDATRMTAGNTEPTVSWRNVQEEAEKSWRGGKDWPWTEGGKEARTVAALRKRPRGWEGRRAKTGQHPERSARETRFFYSFISPAHSINCNPAGLQLLFQTKMFYLTKCLEVS